MTKFLMASGLALGLSSFAFAASPPFEDLDSNRDGKISRQEGAAKNIDFARADMDDDGLLTRSEYDSAEVGARFDPHDPTDKANAVPDTPLK